MNDEHKSQPAHNPNYVGIFLILGVLTIIEVLVATGLEGIKIPILIVLAACKASLVAMFYMHLRFDSRIFSGVFVGPLLLGGAMVITLILLLSSAHLV